MCVQARWRTQGVYKSQCVDAVKATALETRLSLGDAVYCSLVFTGQDTVAVLFGGLGDPLDSGFRV